MQISHCSCTFIDWPSVMQEVVGFMKTIGFSGMGFPCSAARALTKKITKSMSDAYTCSQVNLSLKTQGRFKDLKLEGCQFKEGGLGVALKVKRNNCLQFLKVRDSRHAAIPSKTSALQKYKKQHMGVQGQSHRKLMDFSDFVGLNLIFIFRLFYTRNCTFKKAIKLFITSKVRSFKTCRIPMKTICLEEI